MSERRGSSFGCPRSCSLRRPGRRTQPPRAHRWRRPSQTVPLDSVYKKMEAGDGAPLVSIPSDAAAQQSLPPPAGDWTARRVRAGCGPSFRGHVPCRPRGSAKDRGNGSFPETSRSAR